MAYIDAWGNDAATRADYEYAQAEAWAEIRRQREIEAAEEAMANEPWDWDRMTQDELIDNEEEYPREQ
jgi:hypothetical protein